jgi:hypothetical protein
MRGALPSRPVVLRLLRTVAYLTCITSSNFYTSAHMCVSHRVLNDTGARGSVVGRGTMLQAGRSCVPFPMGSEFFN